MHMCLYKHTSMHSHEQIARDATQQYTACSAQISAPLMASAVAQLHICAHTMHASWHLHLTDVLLMRETLHLHG